MPDGRRSIWTTREGAVIIAACVIVVGLVIWGATSWLDSATRPAPKQQPPAKTKPDRPEQQPPPKFNPDANP